VNVGKMASQSSAHGRQAIGVAISGGIDSLVTAHLLKEQGYPVVGIHFLTGYETGAITEDIDTSVSGQIAAARRRLHPFREQLDIPITVVDVSAAFERIVVRYFTDTYRTGRTPNPCLVCNPSIKFDLILSKALDLGATHLATGHYARIREDRRGQFHLYRGIDRRKDQSYFLSFLTQEKLSRAVFPLGEWTKDRVRELAAEEALRPILSAESQDVCFIKSGGYSEFLQNREGFEPFPGLIEDLNGNILGEHSGLHGFTVGQRRGINCPASEPYYVIRLDSERNRLIVGFQGDTLSSGCRVEQINWIRPPDDNPVNVHTRVRYRHTAAASEVRLFGDTGAEVRFETPQSAVTPGQGAVFYRKDEVIGGGFIVDTVK